ncbi:hypothetical protein DPSP01_013970 [Paraphaeosphaeria sporulosa]
MDSAKATAASAVAATPPPNGRKQHKPSSSLGSLYEVLADLDENQLEYLLQEMNHTGHQNVKVSQAVSAFDSQSPPESLSAIRASMLPSAPGLQRQTSKSQQGKLRLQTAFQRAPSLKQRQQTDFRASLKPAQAAATETPRRGTPRSPPVQQPAAPNDSPIQPVITNLPPPSPEPEIHLQKRGSTTTNTAKARRPTTSSIRTISAYKRIPRPDFNLPPGITVPDLLQLLEAEFLSSTSLDPGGSPISTSPASAFPGQLSLSPSISLSASPAPPGGRTLRRHSSRLDMALEAERNASGVEEIGLGMLEPRGSPSPASLRRASAASLRRSSAASLRGSNPGTPVEGFGFVRSETPPVVMEGIFDVLENR